MLPQEIGTQRKAVFYDSLDAGQLSLIGCIHYSVLNAFINTAVKERSIKQNNYIVLIIIYQHTALLKSWSVERLGTFLAVQQLVIVRLNQFCDY